MAKITITEDIDKGTFTIYDNDKSQFVLREKNNINFSDDDVYDVLGEKEYTKLHEKGKSQFDIPRKKL